MIGYQAYFSYAVDNNSLNAMMHTYLLANYRIFAFTLALKLEVQRNYQLHCNCKDA